MRRAAARAKTAPLAAKRHQVFMKTAVALYAQEAVLKQPALQIVLKLLADESWQVTANAFDLPHEVRIMFRNDGIERGLFRSVPLIGGRDGNRGRRLISMRVSEHRSLSMPRSARLNLPGVPQHVTQRVSWKPGAVHM
jgi:hypothetical protein